MSRLPASLAREIGARDSITIRPSHTDDADRLEQLAELAERPLPAAPFLIAESDNDVIAAVSVVTGDAITDPFHVTTDLIALLRFRADQLEQIAA